MKIKKLEDEKYFKDIVLNNILDEISNETGAPRVSKIKKRKLSKNRFFTGVLFVIAILFFLFIFAVLFHLKTNTITKAEIISKPDINTTVDTEDWKMEEDRASYKKITRHKEPHDTKKKRKKTLSVKKVVPKKSKFVPRKKTERELAKEALRRQMLN